MFSLCVCMADVAEAPLYRARPYLTAAAAATAVAAAYGTASTSVPAAKHYLALSAKLPRKRTVTPANDSGVGQSWVHKVTVMVFCPRPCVC